jgi:hypothetical protein
MLIESYAGALRVGIGYELRLRSSLKLRPEFLHIRTFGEEVDEGGEAVQRRLAPRVTMIQVGLTWR